MDWPQLCPETRTDDRRPHFKCHLYMAYWDIFTPPTPFYSLHNRRLIHSKAPWRKLLINGNEWTECSGIRVERAVKGPVLWSARFHEGATSSHYNTPREGRGTGFCREGGLNPRETELRSFVLLKRGIIGDSAPKQWLEMRVGIAKIFTQLMSTSTNNAM